MIFKGIDELRKFEEIFETKFIFTKKKDYIEEPKENGYQSLHYTFMTPYANNEVFVELQLRTEQMDREIHEAKEISHYSYTIKANKWDKMFEEVQFGYSHLLQYIEKRKK
jgi:(p)ppGpp synthase/HD superfamily hydrolase